MYDLLRSPHGGQSMAEYALIVSGIVVVAVIALGLFGTQISDVLSAIAVQINE